MSNPSEFPKESAFAQNREKQQQLDQIVTEQLRLFDPKPYTKEATPESPKEQRDLLTDAIEELQSGKEISVEQAINLIREALTYCD